MIVQPAPLTISKMEWLLMRDAVADIACWHMGFAAAKPDYQEPPQLKALSDLMNDLKRRVIIDE